MRGLVTVALAIAAVAIGLTAAAPAVAQNAAKEYPWCAAYADDHGGRNCGFTSYEQCMAALFGNGGICERNAFYRGDPRPAPPPPRRPVPRSSSN